MRAFGLDFDTALNLPLKRFWFLVNHLPRIMAEEQLRQFQLLTSANDAKGAEMAMKNLSEEMGQVYVWEEPEPGEVRIDPKTGRDPEFDKDGLSRLKALAG